MPDTPPDKILMTMIQTERLDLIPMTLDFLKASLAGNRQGAERELGLEIPDRWFEAGQLITLRLGQLQADPELLPWLLRAIGLRRTRTMIGYLGFHDKPGADYMAEIAPGGIEFGYTIFPPHRRRGYAYEACLGLITWGFEAHGIERFVVSISPQNGPSLKLAHKLGFRRIGTHIDEIDGPEDIFERRFSDRFSETG